MPHRADARPSHPSDRRGPAVVCALVLALTAGVHSPEPASASTATAVIAGVVHGTDGMPAVGVTVSLRNDDGGGWDRRATTDGSGAYRFEGVEADRYAVSFGCVTGCVGNYLPEYWDDTRSYDDMAWLELADGAQVELETELTVAGEISGVVRGDDGTPVADVSVHIEAVTPDVIPPQGFVVTDDDGGYRFRNLPEAGYLLQFVPQKGSADEHFDEFWKDRTTAASADVIHVAPGEAVSGIDADLTRTAWISGRVVNEDGEPLGWDADVDVFLYRLTDAGTSWVMTEDLSGYPLGPGEFRFDHLTAGEYVLRTRSLEYGVAEWWDDQPDLASATPIVLDVGERFHGTVVLEGTPVSLSGPTVSGTARVGEMLTASASSSTAGASLTYQWSAGDVPIPGATDATFTPTADQIGDRLSVQVVASAPGRGTVTRDSGLTAVVEPGALVAPIPGINGAAVVGTALTATTGDWTSGTELAYEWYRGGALVSRSAAYTLSSADAGSWVRVDVTGTKPGYTTVTRSSGGLGPVIHGTVALTTPTITGTPQVGSALTAVASSSTPGSSLEYEWFLNGASAASGPTFTLGTQHLGARISVRVTAFAKDYRSVTLTSGQVGPVSSPVWGSVSRIAGTDRYATSAAVSRASFAPGVDTVFIASGTGFPDALSGAGVAALRNGPLLLTPSTGLPQVVIDEIKRLRPKTAIIFGGTGVVSSRVEAQLESLTQWKTADRFGGADRYASSVAISRMEFSPLAPPPVVYVANGTNFPDALSGAPLAGRDRGPLLLSTATTLPGAVAKEIDRLNPGRIVILGGTGSISDAVARQLKAYTTGGVSRLAGADRYQTSAAISKASFDPGVPVAYIANGANFPDALSGAPVAAIQGGPVLLTPATSLPAAAVAELERLRPERIVILGGTGSVSAMVHRQLDALG